MRGVSGEEQRENPEGTFIPGEKHHVCEREVQGEQREGGREHRRKGQNMKDKERKTKQIECNV